VQALASSEDSDSNSLMLQKQIADDATQKQSDDAARKQEQKDSATAYSGLSGRVETLQSYFDALSSKLTDFSGSDADKQAAALAAVDSITAGVKKVELENTLLKVGLVVTVVTAVGIGIYAAVR
jgi:hypothetical protein